MKPGVARAAKNAELGSKNEVVYPFGVQNDLGYVILTRNQKSCLEDHGEEFGVSPPASSAHKSVSPPLFPHTSCGHPLPEPELLSPRILTASASHLSLTSTRHNSLASSLSDLSYDAAILDRALRTNDVPKARKCFEKHRDRFQVLERPRESGESCEGPNGPISAGPETKGAGKKFRPPDIGGEMEESPVTFTNALHLAVEWGANDVLKFLLKESVDPNRGGRVPDNYEISGAGSSRSASVSGWGSECVFAPPSPKTLSRDASPNRETAKNFYSRNVSSDSSRCVSPSRERKSEVFSTPGSPGGYLDSRTAHLRREAFKNLAGKGDGEDPPAAPSEIRPIISVVYCASNERRPSAKNSCEIVHPEGQPEGEDSDDDQCDGDGKDLSFSSLLAAHSRRRSERSVSYSSCSCSDVSVGSETFNVRKPMIINPGIGKELLVVGSEGGREVSFADHYTPMHLMTLGPIFLAACRGRSTTLTILLQHGASPGIPDSFGNTPLHLAVIQSPTPWDLILDLMEAGSKITLKNYRGVSPIDLLPSLRRLQKQLVADCWLDLARDDPSLLADQSESGGREMSSRSSRLFKKLHEARYHREKGEMIRGSIPKCGKTGLNGDKRTEILNVKEGPNPCFYHRASKGGEDGIESKHKKMKKKKDKPGKSYMADPVKFEWSELARCLMTLKSVATNEECLDEILQGLVLHSNAVLGRFQQILPTTEVPYDPHKALSAFFHTIISVSVNCHGKRDDPKKFLSDVMSSLAKAALLFATGPHPLQYTAMVALNKIVDVSIVYRLMSESWDLVRPEEPKRPIKNNKDGPMRRFTSRFHVLDILEPAVGPVVNILHNAVTLYKRTIGSRQICTPSMRKRSCSAHCLQLLSARLLVFLVHSPAVQRALVAEAPLRIFIAALDATHDPQLLCLVLQILATLALDPNHHKGLIEAGVPDALPPLLLPADEFFYTNHTTLFGRYVKHHAARLLVYLGLHHRSALRVSVFDLITNDESTMGSGSLGNEDLFITWTCSTPAPVFAHGGSLEGNSQPLIAISVESTIIRVLKSLETSISLGSPYLREPASAWQSQSPSRHQSSSSPHNFRRHSAESRRNSIGGPELDQAFVRIFLTCYPAIVHPTILLRLLLHRLLSTGLALRRWKSCASRASFASAYSGHSGNSVFSNLSAESRTSRSRASSTDTGSIPLRRRRQVSLTVDCGTDLNTSEEREDQILHELEETSPKDEAPTGKKATIRGIFFKWRSSSQEVSVEKSEVEGKSQRESSIFGLLPLASLRNAASRESLYGTSSQNNSPVGSPSFLVKQSGRFGSLHQKKTRRLSRNRSLDVSAEVTSPKDTPEDEILAFQKKLQNLPDFMDTSIEPTSPPAIPPPSPRPRSRSVPKVTLEAPLPLPEHSPSLALSPTLALPSTAHLLSPSSPVGRCPLYQSFPPPPSSPGLLTPHSPKSFSKSPNEEKPTDRPDLGRKCSFFIGTPSRSRQESIFISDMPIAHRAVLLFVEDWISTSRLNGKNNIIRELKDFVTRVSSCGLPYLRWADHIRILCPSLNVEEDVNEADTLQVIENDYMEMQRLVLSGSLPCSKEEAANLAGIQLRLEECWPKFAAPKIQTHVAIPTPTPNLKGDLPHSEPNKFFSERGPVDYESENQIIEESINKKASGVVRAVSLLTTCYSSTDENEVSLSTSKRLRDLVPPYYIHAGNMPRLIKEHKRRLFHTFAYDSATQLQKLYVQSCQMLPAYGSRLIVVKELLRGKTRRKASRLLAIGPHKIVLLDCRTKNLAKWQNTTDLIQWRAGCGRNHDRLLLEFRSSKWTLMVVPVGGQPAGASCGHLGSVGGLREAGRAIWALIREMDANFLEEFTLAKKSPQLTDSTKKKLKLKISISPELEYLEKILHFPEEVVLTLAEKESQLFCQVPSLDYLRYVSLNLTSTNVQDITTNHVQLQGVNVLIERFNEISSWVTHLLVSPPNQDERKAMLSCLLRITRTALNLGAFGTAVEIIAGLKSAKLKPFWLSLDEKEIVIPALDNLIRTLLGANSKIIDSNAEEGPKTESASEGLEYEAALGRALNIPTCAVVPFFGSFLKELRNMLQIPSLVVMSSGSETQQLQNLLDPENEDHFFTKIGLGGLLNMNKLRKVQKLLEKIAVIHAHNSKQQRPVFLHPDRISIHTSSIEKSHFPDGFEPQDTLDDLFYSDVKKEEVPSFSKLYNPVQPLYYDHGVSFIPYENSINTLDLHCLQVLHHGSTALHIDSEGRYAYVWLKLERSCGTIVWSKPAWSSLRFSHTQPDFLLNVDPELIPILPGLFLKYGGVCGGSGGLAGQGPMGIGGSSDVAGIGIEEGYIDLPGVKEIEAGCGEVDVTMALKRHGIDSWSSVDTCVTLVYGAVISDNRNTVFAFPPKLANIWLNGLRSVVKLLRRAIQNPDKRLFWLREQYLQLFFEEGRCLAPTMVDTIRVFGGRKWASSATQGDAPDTPIFKRTASVKFRKKHSIANLNMIKESLMRGSDDSEVNVPPSPIPNSLTRIKSVASMIPGQITEESIGSHGKSSVFPDETRLTFTNFAFLFQAFSLRSRKDLRDLFDSIATDPKSEFGIDSPKDSSEASNFSSGLSKATSLSGIKLESKIYDAIASASIVQNGAGVETSRSKILTVNLLMTFLEIQQEEIKNELEVKSIIKKFETDETLRSHYLMSFEGFARFMMSAHNLAYINETIVPQEEELDHPLAHYFVAASHNTYLSGHQLKGESSVELYSQVLLTGCRCVELDCYDGDDGDPVIYHGHTFTTKISFRQVVEAINKSAFLASCYPVILSIENHCSLQQQARMAWIFQTIFGERLITRFLFETDYTDEPSLPSPAQLKYRFLIKNKKFHTEIVPNLPLHSASTSAQSTYAPALRNRSGSRPQSGRANSIISNISGGSINDEYSDEDVESDFEDHVPEERVVVSRQASEAALPSTPRTDSLTSQESSLRSAKRTLVAGTSTANMYANQQVQHEEVDWKVELEDTMPKTKKQSSQIARELSELVNYVQAIKFRGLNTFSPSSSIRNRVTQKKSILPSNPPTSLPVTPTTSSQAARAEMSDLRDHHMRRVITNHPVYQCSSINENTSKKMCRKTPLQVLAHTETQLIRSYPAGMRIDSSNFNPLIFWAYGIQMAALNYQTNDAALHLNAAMFEQNGRCGYVLKPSVMWDRNHLMYRKFNPMEKEFDGIEKVQIYLTIISGQFLSPSNYHASPFVELEIAGIPVDCSKQRTKTIIRNSLNPIWSETLTFTIQFMELAFLKFTVMDGSSGVSGSGPTLAQRIIPINGLRKGYRHLRLRNIYNQSLPITTLFIHSRIVVGEGEEIKQKGEKFLSKDDSLKEGVPSPEKYFMARQLPLKSSLTMKRRMFFLVIHGVVPEEPYTILKVTQETTVSEVIVSALQKTGRKAEASREYVLIEEVSRGWDSKNKDLPPTQRVLEMFERPLQAQALWKGDGKFVLKRTRNDPSSRAWLSSITSTGQTSSDQRRGRLNSKAEGFNHWEEQKFLVCVHNVSQEIPYAILKVSIKSSSQDVIAQAFVKARRIDEPTKFVLVEELEPLKGSSTSEGSESSEPSRKKSVNNKFSNRILEDDENVYEVQLKWNTVGRFVLRERKQAQGICGVLPGRENSVGKGRSSRGTKISTLSKLAQLRLRRGSEGKKKKGKVLGDRNALSLYESKWSNSRSRKSRARRSTQSEGEGGSNDEPKAETPPDFMASVVRFKKASLKKLNPWK